MVASPVGVVEVVGVMEVVESVIWPPVDALHSA